jgi:ATP-binding protein involved in chromosome partitioning
MVDLQKVLADLFEQSLPDIAYQWSQVATYRVTERLNKSVITITFRFPIALQSALYERTLSRLLMDQGYSQDQFSINMAHDVPIHLVDNHVKPLDSIKNMVLIASGKGGVGKSTVASQLAASLALSGARVGLLDADVYGPNQTIMMGSHRQPRQPGEKAYDPVEVHGVVMQSMGHFVPESQPLVWRGPMLSSALEQMIMKTHWPALDYLLVDMPPGTGDIPLTLAKKMPVSGVVMVCTPERVACADTARSMAMFQKMALPILGLVENMSVFSCPHCHQDTALFGQGGVDALAGEYAVPVLGRLPLDRELQAQCQAGDPLPCVAKEHAMSVRFLELAHSVLATLAIRPVRFLPKSGT